MKTSYLELSYIEMKELLYWIGDKLRKHRKATEKIIISKKEIKKFKEELEEEFTKEELEEIKREYNKEMEEDWQELLRRLDSLKQMTEEEKLITEKRNENVFYKIKEQREETMRRNKEMFALLPEEIKKTIKDEQKFLEGKMRRKTVRLLEKFYLAQGAYLEWAFKF